MLFEQRCRICKSNYRSIIENLHQKQKWTLKEIREYSCLNFHEIFSEMSLSRHFRLHTKEMTLPEQIILPENETILKPDEEFYATIYMLFGLNNKQLTTIEETMKKYPSESIVTKENLYTKLQTVVREALPNYLTIFEDRWNKYWTETTGSTLTVSTLK